MNSPPERLISCKYPVYPSVSDISLPARRYKEFYAVDDTKQTCFIEIGLRDIRIAMTYGHRVPSVRALCILLRLHRKDDGNKSISTWSENYKLERWIYNT